MKTTSTAINRLFGSTRSKLILLAIVIGVGHLLVYNTSCETCNSLFTSFRNKTVVLPALAGTFQPSRADSVQTDDLASPNITLPPVQPLPENSSSDVRCRARLLSGNNRSGGFIDLSAGVITGGSNGRLGNNLMEYATIFGMGIKYNMTAVATPYLLRRIARVFPHTSMPVVSDDCVKNFTTISPENFEAMNDTQRRKGKWNISYYLHRIRTFWYYREDLFKEFRFRHDLTKYANVRLHRVAAGRSDVTFVGVHVRRTDFVKHMQNFFHGHLVNASFFHSAMSLCRKRYNNPAFIVTSDDKQWCRQHLSAPDVHFLGDPRSESPGVERDLALLAACNHTIFDYGTYGFFAAFLAGGDMILADGVSEIESEEVTELREGKINATFIDGNGRVLPICVRCS
ncbi:galactoside alpha-(1,2)-fucosyltransferase 2-like isoform X1 [Amphibalanus amphitrite]|uniref:galactoside alpha-(1,2)-fucosyltransferase 2-like isoform X1 n=1 Tax=Amphibalanus amphitrite TaxID=1232801 RepID=UPI001C903F56|nr:galactoside alpha-(1,2)-fucosyltransferase 2-like isoform X1 [Amphibalanus amphitrite]